MAIIVLCVDDNADGLAVRKALLEAKGYETFTASDGPTGIALAEKHSFDLVVLDYQMPGMNGEEVALALKTRHPHLPIILLSGFPGALPEGCFSWWMRLSPRVSRQPCCYHKWNRSLATKTSEE